MILAHHATPILTYHLLRVIDAWCDLRSRTGTDAQVRLGFHMTAKPGQGALHVTCPGCALCAGIKSPFMRKFQPFPHVPTDAVLAADELGNDDPSTRVRNLSVTASTLFSLHATSPGCRLHITHVRSAAPRLQTSRVRVDSLVLYAVSNRSGPCPDLVSNTVTQPKHLRGQHQLQRGSAGSPQQHPH